MSEAGPCNGAYRVFGAKILKSKFAVTDISLQATMVKPKTTLVRTIWIGLAITIVFVAVTVLLVSVPASRFTDSASREYAAGIARIIVGLMVILGIVFACLRISGRSIWPVAVLHGVMNAFVHVNRIGIEIEPSLLRAAALAFAPVPLCIYGAILLRERGLITTR